MDDIAQWTWSPAQLPQGMALLAMRFGLHLTTDVIPAPPLADWDEHDQLHTLAAHLGCELEPQPLRYADLPARLPGLGPGLLQLGDDHGAGWILIVRSNRRKVTLITPHEGLQHIPIATLTDAVRRPFEQGFSAEIDNLLQMTEIDSRRRSHSRKALLAELLSGRPVATALRLQPIPNTGLRRQLVAAGATWPAAAFISTYIGSMLLFSGSWWLLDRAIGVGPSPWLSIWAAAMLGYVILRATSRLFQERLTVMAGGVIKRHLLFGATRLHPDAMRNQGIGQLMGSVIESDNVEFLVLNGGFPALKALINLGFAFTILLIGTTGLPHALLLLGWLGLCAVIGWRFYHERTAWNDARLATTHDAIEQIVGYRTMLTQQPAGLRTAEQTANLGRYRRISEAMDHTMTWLITFMPRGWLLVSVVVMVVTVQAGAGAAGVVVSLGASLLAYQALGYLNLAIAHAVSLIYALRRIAPFLYAARSSDPKPSAEPAQFEDPPLLALREMSFRYRPTATPVLDNCDLTVRSGDRMLLEGRSGSGKSTLIALMAGLRQPDSGVILLNGMERSRIDPSLRSRMLAIAPQFHENYIFTGTLAFNLLIGRGWPASDTDLAEADAICRELGLGGLIDLMPAGLQQVVGETGWQLSHGERSRIYLARALLQGTDLIVLDESFAALDPETLRTSIACAVRRAPTLIVAVHP